MAPRKLVLRYVPLRLVFWMSCSLAAFLPPASAINIPDYRSEVYDLFESGFAGGAPVLNSHADFIGSGYDWSGVGWGTSIDDYYGSARRIQMFGMLSPVHAYSALHYGLVGTEARFVGRDGGLVSTRYLISPQGTPSAVAFSSDRRLTYLEEPLSAADQVAVYRILDTADGTYSGMPSFLMGSDLPHDGGPRVVAGTVGSVGLVINHWMNGVVFETGDSGAPQFLAWKGELTLAGATWFAGGSGSTVLPNSVENVVGAMNQTIAKSGFALKWRIYDEPGQTSRTANRWTGAGSDADVGNASNWSLEQTPDGRSLVIGAVATGGRTTLNFQEAQVVRGLLFSAEAGEEYLLEGERLTLGAVGILNESGREQTIRNDLTLSDSQNWESISGTLRIEGAIGNQGHLVVVGGAGDTVIGGSLSGAGALAKDDKGTLTLSAANSYTGVTFLHDGTLRLAAPGALRDGSTLVIGNRGQAVLDLQGQRLSIGDVRTTSFAGETVVKLGGGELVIETVGNKLNTLGAGIDGEGSFIKRGVGTLAVTGNTTQVGEISIEDGALRLHTAPSQARTVLRGGVLEVAHDGSPTRLGTGLGEVRFEGSGGFSAWGADRVITLGTSTLTWGQEHFLKTGETLKLSSNHANATVELTNHLQFGGPQRTIQVANGTAAIDARLSGSLTGGGLHKTGSGLLELTGVNTYTGETRLSGGGQLLISGAQSLSSGNVTLIGGVLMLGHSDMIRGLGTGQNQVRLTGGNSGFAAYGSDRRVNLGGNSELLTWGMTHFLGGTQPLVFSAAASNATLIFENPMDFAGGQRLIRVDNGSAQVDARLAGVISNGSLQKLGAGVLELAQANHALTGGVHLAAGGLAIASDVALGGGNLLIEGDLNTALFLKGESLTRSVGTAAGQIHLRGSGGFAAIGGERTVNLGGNGESLTWGINSFLAEEATLVLGHASSDGTLIFENAINLNGAERAFHVGEGTAAIDARLSGSLSNGGVIKQGGGVLELTGINSYSGRTVLQAGALLLKGESALGNGNFLFDGVESGVLILGSGGFTRALGTGAQQVRFLGHGGFAASGGDRLVNLGGEGAEVVWGSSSSSFLASSMKLILSHEQADSTLIFANAIALNGQIRTVEVRDGSAAVDARMTGVINGGGVIKTGQGTLELTAQHQFSGSLEVSEGRVVVSETGGFLRAKELKMSGGELDYRSLDALKSAVTLDAGTFRYNSDAAYQGRFQWRSGRVSGVGNLELVETRVGAGQVIAPGNSVGSLRMGSQVWAGGGAYEWELGDWAGELAGEAWDLLEISGTLSITADANDRFLLRLNPFELSGTPGGNRSFTLVTTTGGISGFSAEAFLIDATAFGSESGFWSLGVEENALMLHHYSSVPEPGTALMLLLGMAAVAGLRHRREGTLRD